MVHSILTVHVKILFSPISSHEVVLLEATSCPPFRIDNKSVVTLVYHQQDVDCVKELGPGQSTPCAWDDLSKDLSLVAHVKGSPGLVRTYDLQVIITHTIIFIFITYFFFCRKYTPGRC